VTQNSVNACLNVPGWDAIVPGRLQMLQALSGLHNGVALSNSHEVTTVNYGPSSGLPV
jgi:hypothetical protein